MGHTSSVPHPIPDELAELIAARFGVLGEPMRIKLLDRLRSGGATVSELQAALGTTQQNVSKHLAILFAAGIVSRARKGTAVRYEIADESVFAICEQICGGLRRQIDHMDSVLRLV